MNESKNKYCFYITYDGLLDPLGSSQILPYILGLSSLGQKIILLSFEKTDRSRESIYKLDEFLKSKNIFWIKFPFKKQRFGYFIRIFQSCYLIKSKLNNVDFSLFHTRTILTAIVYFICRFKCPLIYDIRAFAGEYIDCGRINPNSIFSFFLLWFEKKIIKKSSGIVVLDDSGADYIKNKFKNISSKIKIIPTCCNTKSFPTVKKELSKKNENKLYRLVFLGGARFPYRPDLALILVKKLIEYRIPCCIDFINERDKDYIKKNCEDQNIPGNVYNIFSLPQEEVSYQLINYDSGLIFNTSGYWRKKSCPTKLGEYLSAGLHIISLSGINIIDRLSSRNISIFDIFDETNFEKSLSKNRLKEIERKIKSPNLALESRKLAIEHFDISIANIRYKELYNELLDLP